MNYKVQIDVFFIFGMVKWVHSIYDLRLNVSIYVSWQGIEVPQIASLTFLCST